MAVGVWGESVLVVGIVGSLLVASCRRLVVLLVACRRVSRCVVLSRPLCVASRRPALRRSCRRRVGELESWRPRPGRCTYAVCYPLPNCHCDN